VQHLIVPLDSDHVQAVASLAAEVAAAAGCADVGPPVCPHVTVVAFTGVDPEVARRAIEWGLAGAQPFEMRAHGYGVFAQSGEFGPSLNVPVVRNGPLDTLHRAVHQALVEVGAEVAGWTLPDTWSPHITLTDRALDTDGVGAAVSRLAGHRHPSWRLPVDRVLLVGGWSEPVDERTAAIPLPPSR
jgi:2'-5' RNA ligase